MFSVYVICCTITKMCYVGITRRCVERRIKEHLRGVQIIDREIKRIGWDKFDWWTVEKNISADNISEREKFWIKFYDSIAPNGYNQRDGGFKDMILSEEAKSRISAANSKPKSPEAVARQKGKPHPHKGSPKSALTREKIRSKALGRKRSEESCKKQSETMTGEGNHFFGKHHSMKTLELLHKPKAKEAVLKMSTTKIRNNQVSLLRPLFGDKAELIRKLDSDIYIKYCDPFSDRIETVTMSEYHNLKLRDRARLNKSYLCILNKNRKLKKSIFFE